ncbi:hypothetical protein Q7P35_005937 [Cladosporium inversicolor]
MPPTWQIKLAAVLASTIMFAIKMLILKGMENYVHFAVHLSVSIFPGSTITAAIGWIIDQIQLAFCP